jgi:hypothetical protein
MNPSKNTGLLLIVVGALVTIAWLGHSPVAGDGRDLHASTHPRAYQLAALVMVLITAWALGRILRGGRRDQ